MADSFLVQFLSRSVKIFHAVGVPYPLPPNFKKFGMFLWRIYSFTIMALNATFLLTAMAGIPSAMSDIALFATAVFPVTITLQVILRRVCLWQHRRSLSTVFQDLKQVSRDLEKSNLLKNPLEYKRMTTFINRFQAIRFVLQNMCIFYLSAYLFHKSWQGKSLTTPVIAWYPFDQKDPIINLVVIALQEISIVANMLILCSTDLFLQTLLVAPTILNIYLAECLKVIMEKARNGERKEAWNDLLWWLKNHQVLLRALSKISRFFTPILVVYYSLTLMEIMVSLLTIVTKSSWNLYHKLLVVSTGCTTLSLFFILCLVGDNLKNKETNVATASYDTNMILSDIQFKKTFYFIHMRCMVGTSLGVSGVYQLSLQTFATLIQATFSVYLTLLQLKLKGTEDGMAFN